MYITENQSIGESVLFLLTARSTLAEMIAESDHENADEMIGFLLNEATDYEIMSLLVDGKLPVERYNEGHEIILFSRLKEAVLMNAGELSEAMGHNTFNDFMTKVDSVYPRFSTQTSMLEFFALQNSEIAIAVLTEGSFPDLNRVLLEKFPWQRTPTEKAVKTGKEYIEKGQEYAGKGLEAGKEAAEKGMKMGKEYAGKAGEAVQKYAGKGLDWIKSQVDSAGEVVGKLSSQQAALGGAAVAALLAFGAAKTYKRFFSKAAKACAGMGGSAKTQCMQQYKVTAKAAQATDLARAKAAIKRKRAG